MSLKSLLILVLSSHLDLGHPSVLFLSDFPIKILYEVHFAPKRATYLAHLILLNVNAFIRVVGLE
jgi:hypothetical protein